MYLVGSDPAAPCSGEPNCEGGELEASAEKLTIGDTLDCTGPASVPLRRDSRRGHIPPGQGGLQRRPPSVVQRDDLASRLLNGGRSPWVCGARAPHRSAVVAVVDVLAAVGAREHAGVRWRGVAAVAELCTPSAVDDWPCGTRAQRQQGRPQPPATACASRATGESSSPGSKRCNPRRERTRRASDESTRRTRIARAACAAPGRPRGRGAVHDERASLLRLAAITRRIGWSWTGSDVGRRLQ